MDDFKNNKDSKLKEIKVSYCSLRRSAPAQDQADIANKKKELGKQTTQVKTRQKEVQTVELELRMSPDYNATISANGHRANG